VKESFEKGLQNTGFAYSVEAVRRGTTVAFRSRNAHRALRMVGSTVGNKTIECR
jgi:hypothetical protein